MMFGFSVVNQDVIATPNSKIKNPVALFVTQLKKLAEDRASIVVALNMLDRDVTAGSRRAIPAG